MKQLHVAPTAPRYTRDTPVARDTVDTPRRVGAGRSSPPNTGSRTARCSGVQQIDDRNSGVQNTRSRALWLATPHRAGVLSPPGHGRSHGGGCPESPHRQPAEQIRRIGKSAVWHSDNSRHAWWRGQTESATATSDGGP